MSPVTQVKHYPALPHGVIEEVFEGVWFVQGQIKMPTLLPVKFSRAMTVIKGDQDELTLINTMRLSESGLADLEQLGRVRYVIRIAGFHGRDDAFYRDRYGAKLYAVEGQEYVRGLGKKNAKPYMEPDVYLNDKSALPIADAKIKIIPSSTPPEAVILLEKEGGILIAGDSLQHMEKPDRYFNFLAKVMMKKMGFFKACNVGPGWLKFATPKVSDVRALLDMTFSHVLPCHGDPVIDNAREKYRPAITGELDGAQA